MRSWVFVVLIACGGGSKPAPAPQPPVAKPIPPPKTEPAKAEPTKQNPDDCNNIACAIAILDDFTKQMCACKDKACADAVNDKLQAWGNAMSNKPDLDNAKPTDEQAQQASDIIQRYSACMVNMMGDDDAPPKPTTGLGGGLKL